MAPKPQQQQSSMSSPPSPLVWFLLLDSATGLPYKGTTADYVSLAPGSMIAQFRDAVKAKYSNKLSSVDAGELLVYKNKTAFGKKEALDPTESLGVLGSKEDMLVVVFSDSTAAFNAEFAPKIKEVASSGAPVLQAATETKMAFEAPFRNAKVIVPPFLKHAASVASDFTPDAYHSPYFALIQSSGAGKSRLLFFVGELCFIIYVCIRPPKSTGFPSRTKIIASKLCADLEGENEAYYSYYLAACYHMLEKMLPNVTPVEWLALMTKEESAANFWKEVDNMVTGWIKQEPRPLLSAFGEVFKSLKEKLQAYYSQNAFPTWFPEDVKQQLIKDPFVIHVIDEARNLTLLTPQKSGVNCFRLFRRALRAFSTVFQELLHVTVPTDTNSKVWNYSPQLENDPSLRDLTTGTKLFEPYWTIGSWNAPPSSIATQQMGFELLTVGRPLWAMTWQVKIQQSLDAGSISRHLIQLAKAKLLGGCDVMKRIEQSTFPSTTESIALLDSRFLLFVSPCSLSASELISQNMALCVGVGEDRSSVHCSYASEPSIVAASAELTESPRIFRSVLSNVVEIMHTGLVAAGYRGEFLARIMLLGAWDSACKKRNLPKISNREHPLKYLKPLSLCEYLESLIPKEKLGEVIAEQVQNNIADNDQEMEEAGSSEAKPRASKRHKSTSVANANARYTKMTQADCNRLLNGTVCANHVVLVADKKYLNMERLKSCYRLGAIIMCPTNYAGIDLIVPVLLTSGEYSCIVIQARNYTVKDTKIPFATANCALSGLEFFDGELVPYVLLYMQFGNSTVYGHRSNVYNLRLENTRLSQSECLNQLAIGLFDISSSTYAFLAEDAATNIDYSGTLQNILIHLREKLASMRTLPKEEHAKKTLMRMLSLSYDQNEAFQDYDPLISYNSVAQ